MQLQLRGLALAAPLSLCLAACGGGNSGSGSASSNGAGTLASAADATLKQPSEDVTVSAKIDLSGQTLSLDGSGAFDNPSGAGELHLRFSLGSFGSSTLDEVFQGNAVWLRSPLLSSSLHGKQWVKVDLAKNERAFGLDLKALTGQTPATALEALRLPGTVTKVGTDRVGGVDTTHYRETPRQTAGGNAYRSLEAWVDTQSLVRKLRLDYTAKVDPGGGGGAHTMLTMTLSNFGTQVSVAPPPAAQVIDVSQVGK